jgi:hypothetical protein
MRKLTELERKALQAILSPRLENGRLDALLSDIVVKERSFSVDVASEANCVGFYTRFEPYDLGSAVEYNSAQLSVQMMHPKLSIGADFILFVKADRTVDFLEATFYGETLPIESVESAEHQFSIPAA